MATGPSDVLVNCAIPIKGLYNLNALITFSPSSPSKMPKSPSISNSVTRHNPLNIEKSCKCNEALFNELLRLHGCVDLPAFIPKPQVPPGLRVLPWRLYAGNAAKVNGPDHAHFEDLGRQYCEVSRNKCMYV